MTGPADEALDPRAWLKRAESSLACARAGHGVSGVLLEDLCFHAHQAVEKGLKALLIARSIGFPKTHAIARLPENRAAGAGEIVGQSHCLRSVDALPRWAHGHGAGLSGGCENRRSCCRLGQSYARCRRRPAVSHP